PALLYVVWRGGLVLAWATLVLAALALFEYLRLVLGPGQVYAKVLGYALAGLVALAILGWLPPSLLLVALPAGILGLFVAVLFWPEPIASSISRAGLLALGALYAGGLLPYLSRLRDLDSNLGLGVALM